ncbi:dual specificity protein kinase yak1 [Podila verticillata]|nr:dual specificity protein kinase yak1 [Podila verticillata]
MECLDVAATKWWGLHCTCVLNERYDMDDQHHILRLQDTFIYRRHLCLVFELLSVNLYELIKQNQFRGLSPGDANYQRCIAAELFLGLPLFPGSSKYKQLCQIVEMLGMPPSYMLEIEKTSHEFFEVSHSFGSSAPKKLRLKSIETYSEEHGVIEQPSKRHFQETTLPDIVKQLRKRPTVVLSSTSSKDY